MDAPPRIFHLPGRTVEEAFPAPAESGGVPWEDVLSEGVPVEGIPSEEAAQPMPPEVQFPEDDPLRQVAMQAARRTKRRATRFFLFGSRRQN